MNEFDPFEVLGVAANATPQELRAARRRRAKELHPDAGGTLAAMQRLNQAYERALAGEPPVPPPPPPDPPPPPAPSSHPLQRDMPSFVMNCLPAEAFEALFIVGNWFGDVVDDEQPYRLDLRLYEPGECLCRFDLVPDAGTATVSITIAAVGRGPAPAVESVRDLFVDALNELGSTG
jgi:hypothetical protein